MSEPTPTRGVEAGLRAVALRLCDVASIHRTCDPYCKDQRKEFAVLLTEALRAAQADATRAAYREAAEMARRQSKAFQHIGAAGVVACDGLADAYDDRAARASSLAGGE